MPLKRRRFRKESLRLTDRGKVGTQPQKGKQTGERRRGREMEEAEGVVKHVVLAKFKEEMTDDQIDQLIKGYADLVNHVEPMKSFHWGKDVSAENMHQGFTHVFESTFESTKGVAEYVAHPAHVDFANKFLASTEKVVVIDYKPTTVRS
ncbi:hypothetical protein HS088_TW01G00016 [Tripterygium wilfordii]|uniref:Stress-response A/B barrel domain-containing protein n=2 Tax=Tripterygium wilfordii TaxID=458696 RepID=A0A7J7E0Q2_TRIWF|nr:hypothetical protein HS088_TW01G00016 [Tripterygium wilfordii]